MRITDKITVECCLTDVEPEQVDAIAAIIDEAADKYDCVSAGLADLPGYVGYWRGDSGESVHAIGAAGIDGATVYIDCDHRGSPSAAEITRAGIRAHLLSRDHSNAAVWLAEWGVDETGPDEVGEDYAGECSIWVQPLYHEGTLGAPIADYLRGDGGEIVVYATYAEAQAIVDAYYTTPHCLSHGQAGLDTLTIVEDGYERS